MAEAAQTRYVFQDAPTLWTRLPPYDGDAATLGEMFAAAQTLSDLALREVTQQARRRGPQPAEEGWYGGTPWE